MRDVHEEISDKGARLVVIGNGRPEHARALREDLAFGGDLWVDEEMRAYRAAGLRRSRWRSVAPRVLWHAWRAKRAGHGTAGLQGDPWQLGGAFVVSTAGETVYAHHGREAGDHAPLDELLGALDRAGGA